MDISVHEGASLYLDYTLTYSQGWSDSSKRGTPIPSADVTKVFFYVKRKLTDTTFLLQLSSADSSQIAWTSATAGTLRVKLGANTAGLAGNAFYELRLKMSDGRYITADDGRITFKESVVDQAS
jgi:hypothetical protein